MPMKSFFSLIIVSLVTVSNLIAQDAKTYYDQGMEKARAGKLEEAIALFDKSIELNQNEYVVWFNREWQNQC
jgi:tetratricopeptide (TPR) repeat protein